MRLLDNRIYCKFFIIVGMFPHCVFQLSVLYYWTTTAVTVRLVSDPGSDLDDLLQLCKIVSSSTADCTVKYAVGIYLKFYFGHMVLKWTWKLFSICTGHYAAQNSFIKRFNLFKHATFIIITVKILSLHTSWWDLALSRLHWKSLYAFISWIWMNSTLLNCV